MDTTGMLFPKVKSKKKRKKHHASIIPCNRKGVCYLCKRHTYTHEHHIFDGANRSQSEEYGVIRQIKHCLFRHIKIGLL